MSLSNDVRDYALDLGYAAVGIAPAAPFPRYAAALEQRSAEYRNFDYLKPFADPGTVLPGARSIVVAVYDYSNAGYPEEFLGKVARLYLSRAYMAPPGRLHSARPQLMRQFMEKQGCEVGPWVNHRSGVPDRQAASRAGVALFGRNNFVAGEMGSFIFIHSFVVDQELEYDEPNEGLHCPPNCRLCIEACPTRALIDDLRLDPRRCIAFNTFSTRGPETGFSAYIDKEIRPGMGTWVHGCDVCQEVCPRNLAKTKAKLPIDGFLAKMAKEFDLLSLLSMTDEYYRRVVQPIMYNYIKDQSLFRRNAAIALGNIGDSGSLPALTAALEDEAEVVRAHAAWALGRIGGPRAKAALSAHRRSETGPEARREIEEALQTVS